MLTCNQMWGSHGCDLTADHYGVHQCGSADDPCSQYAETAAGPLARYWNDDTGAWEEWSAHSGGFQVTEAAK